MISVMALRCVARIGRNKMTEYDRYVFWCKINGKTEVATRAELLEWMK